MIVFLLVSNVSNQTKTPVEGFLLRYPKGVAPSISAVNQTITQTSCSIWIALLYLKSLVYSPVRQPYQNI